MMKRFICLALLCLLIAPVLAEDMFTTYKIAYDGATPIADSIATKITSADQAYTAAKATETVMKELKYPYLVDKTEITIVKSRYDAKINTMGYWILAYRGGREVAVNNPIWIYPAPYQVVVSEVYDAKSNEVTLTIKEDPKAAVEGILKMYVDMRPLGKTATGTKE